MYTNNAYIRVSFTFFHSLSKHMSRALNTTPLSPGPPSACHSESAGVSRAPSTSSSPTPPSERYQVPITAEERSAIPITAGPISALLLFPPRSPVSLSLAVNGRQSGPFYFVTTNISERALTSTDNRREALNNTDNCRAQLSPYPVYVPRSPVTVSIAASGRQSGPFYFVITNPSKRALTSTTNWR
jgi:hypothetical protein